MTLAIFGILFCDVQAAVLTFDISGISNFDNVDQGYGDNISAATIGGFSYGAEEGFTPNLTVDYGGSDPSLWTNGYGSLTNVLFENQDNTGVLVITISAEPGYEARLHRFDLSAFNSVFSSSPTIDTVGVGTAGAVEAFRQDDVVISETDFTQFSFTPTIQSSEIIIVVDARNLGGLNDDIAIDNIVFSQVAVPEPSSTILMGLAAFGFVARRKR